MSCLVYCILPRPKTDIAVCARGIDGQPVRLVPHGGLSAAISLLDGEAGPPGVEQLHAYGRVVASFHDRGAVIPLRYGCVAYDASHVVRILVEHAEEYGHLLEELEGCVEIGVRILPAGPPLAAPISSPVGDGPRPRSGLDYLRRRAEYYGRKTRWREDCLQTVERCRRALSGCFRKCVSEPPSSSSPLTSMYFLVRREDIEAFRRAFGEYRAVESAKLLVTGPWPAYNFVKLDRRLTLPEDRN